MVQSFLVVAICLVLSYVFSEIVKKMGLPRIIGQVLAGSLLGIAVIREFLFTRESLNVLSFLANLGVVLMFYYAGLETDFRTFTKNIKKSVLISLFNTVLPLIIGFVVMKFAFGLANLPSIMIAVSLAVSAQSVSLDILEELNLLRTKIGSLILSAGAVDDMLELLIITVLLSSFHFVVNQMALASFLIYVMVFILFVIICRVWLIPWMLKFFDRERSSTNRFMASLIIVLLIAYFSEFLGMGLLIGAMVAGMLVRQTIFREVKLPNWEEHDIARSIHIMAFGFLIPLFFVWIGLNTDLVSISRNIGFIFVFLLIAIATTVLGTLAAVVLSKGRVRDGLLLGWGLTPKGDVELVIAALALNAGIITTQIFTSLVVMSLLTTIIAAIVFRKIVMDYRNHRNTHHRRA